MGLHERGGTPKTISCIAVPLVIVLRVVDDEIRLAGPGHNCRGEQGARVVGREIRAENPGADMVAAAAQIVERLFVGLLAPRVTPAPLEAEPIPGWGALDERRRVEGGRVDHEGADGPG